MVKKMGAVFISFIFLFSLGGCATSRKKNDLELQGLKNQVSVLETQLQSKDEEIGSLRTALYNKEQEQKEPISLKAGNQESVSEVKRRPKNRQIQIALKNAGYNPGIIDGKIGKETRLAVKAFQKDNGLAADGKVGKQTWSLLRKYLYKKVK